MAFVAQRKHRATGSADCKTDAHRSDGAWLTLSRQMSGLAFIAFMVAPTLMLNAATSHAEAVSSGFRQSTIVGEFKLVRQPKLVGQPIMVSQQTLDSQQMLAAELHALDPTEAIVLVDIRSPEEWRQTGVPESALTISMHEPGFLTKLNEALAGESDKAIALICATGQRSAFMQSELRAHGYEQVFTISDGVIGSSTGPGWLGNGFSTRKID